VSRLLPGPFEASTLRSEDSDTTPVSGTAGGIHRWCHPRDCGARNVGTNRRGSRGSGIATSRRYDAVGRRSASAHRRTVVRDDRRLDEGYPIRTSTALRVLRGWGRMAFLTTDQRPGMEEGGAPPPHRFQTLARQRMPAVHSPVESCPNSRAPVAAKSRRTRSSRCGHSRAILSSSALRSRCPMSANIVAVSFAQIMS
jgi:hypothetical protein